MFHRSERLLLRPPFAEDWQAVLGGIADEGVVRNLARAPWPYAEEDARRFLSLDIAPRFPRFLITRARDAALIGCIGIDPIGRSEEATEIGYWIARPFWGQGYATEAGRAVVELARMIGHRKLRACHFVDNPASGRVLRKIGFAPTGTTSMRSSVARGEEVQAIDYALDLDEEDMARPQAA